MKKAITQTIEISGFSHDGRGIARNEAGKVVMIDGALPGETIEYSIASQRKTLEEGHVTCVLKPSPQRIAPHCAHFEQCGGCQQQYITHQHQVEIKQDMLLRLLKDIGKVQPKAILSPLIAEPFGYRRKARLGVRYVQKKDKVLVGFREKQGRFLAELDQCVVLHPQIGLKLKALQQLIYSLEAFKEIPQIEVAVGEKNTALIFRHMKPLSVQDQQTLLHFCQTESFDLYLQPSSVESVHKVWPLDQDERLTYTLPNHQIEMRFHPIDFTQVNFDINRKMIDKVIELLEINSKDKVLDLFCGIGNFSLPIARYAQKVTGLEVAKEMVERAYENANHNHIKNVEFLESNLFEDQKDQIWIHHQYTKALIDPPRTGAKEILPVLAEKNISHIVYVSCNPATLARDANILVHQYGYQLVTTGILDMFAQTKHIESITVFKR